MIYCIIVYYCVYIMIYDTLYYYLLQTEEHLSYFLGKRLKSQISEHVQCHVLCCVCSIGGGGDAAGTPPTPINQPYPNGGYYNVPPPQQPGVVSYKYFPCNNVL